MDGQMDVGHINLIGGLHVTKNKILNFIYYSYIKDSDIK